MPNAAALERGSEVGRLVLEAHRSANGGALPETVAVNLWGLDAIKTKVIETQYSGYTTPQGFLVSIEVSSTSFNSETVAINLWGLEAKTKVGLQYTGGRGILLCSFALGVCTSAVPPRPRSSGSGSHQHTAVSRLSTKPCST